MEAGAFVSAAPCHPQNDGLRLPLAHKRRAVGSCLLLNAVGGTVTGSRLMLGKGIPADPAAIKAKLQKTALDIEAPGYDDKAGAGRITAFKAVMQ
jgi:hypothetical protein